MKRCVRQLSLWTLVAAFVGGQASAQYEPAGNDHPTHDAAMQTGLANPFGAPPASSPMSPEEKKAFAERADLSALRDLAVYHNGRVKIFDTLGRETVETITGRRQFSDFVQTGDGGVEKLSYDPLFTYLDMVIDPAHYLNRPLIHIEYLPLRRLFIELAYTDESTRERWMKLTRLAPAMLATHFGAVAERVGPDAQMTAELERVRAKLRMLEFGHAPMQMVAPPTEQDPWTHVSALPRNSEARQALLELGGAWRAGDAEGVASASGRLAAALPAINPEVYPTTARSLEAAYNRANPFEWGAWLYFGSFLSLVLAFGTGRRWLITLGLVTLLAAMALHTFGFGARWWIAERLPIQNQFESMTGLALAGAAFGLALMIIKRQWLFGAAAAGVGFLVLLTATQTDIPGVSIGREAAILNTSWLLKYHVSTVLLSYGLITLAFLISVLYLVTHYATRGRREAEALDVAAAGLGLDDSQPAGPRRVLADLDTAHMTVLQLAFWTLGVGVLLGAWWADHSWGRWWAFDPKETWALLTWIVYLVIIHVRFVTGSNRALVTAWLSVFGFLVMLWTYFGVNLILPGLHAYA